jgi:PIN domain nuclease of toxin-antitoxin system
VRLLLDTCAFLWAVDEISALSPAARTAIVAPENDVFVSAVSAWEIAVKQSRGKLTLSEPAILYVPKYREMHGFLDLPLDESSVLHVAQLPDAHNDPFDRMLVCQAIAHSLAVVTPDSMFLRYPVRTIW